MRCDTKSKCNNIKLKSDALNKTQQMIKDRIIAAKEIIAKEKKPKKDRSTAKNLYKLAKEMGIDYNHIKNRNKSRRSVNIYELFE
jgi:hypothetical protein